MKRITYIFFAVFYLTLSTKLNASIHFCGGSITSISFFEHSNEDACDCGKLTDNSCCKDFTIKCQVNEDGTNVSKQLNLNPCFKLLNQVLPNLVLSFSTFTSHINSFTLHREPIPPLILIFLSGIILRI